MLKRDYEYETQKTQKLDAVLNKVKSGYKETEEKQNSIEFEKSQLKSELEEAHLLIAQLQREISLYRGSGKQKKNQNLYESHKIREMEYKNKFLQDLADTQQKEIEQLRKEIEILRHTVNQLEESKDVLVEQNRQNENYLKEVADMNSKLTERIKQREETKSLRKSRHSHHGHHKHHSKSSLGLEKEVEEIDRRIQSL